MQSHILANGRPHKLHLQWETCIEVDWGDGTWIWKKKKSLDRPLDGILGAIQCYSADTVHHTMQEYFVVLHRQ